MKVGREAADVHMLAISNEVSRKDEVKALCFAEVVQTCKDNWTAVSDYANSVMKWTHQEYDEKRLVADAAMKMFDESFAILVEYFATVTMVQSDVRRERDNLKRAERDKKSKVAQAFISGGAPETIASAFAEIVSDHNVPGQRCFKVASSTYEVEFKDGESDWCHSNSFLNSNFSEYTNTMSHWHHEVAKLTSGAIGKKLANLAKRGKDALVDSNDTHAVKNTDVEFLINPVGKEDCAFELPNTAVKSYLVCQENYTTRDDSYYYPYRWLPSFITVLDGHLFVLSVPLTAALLAGFDADKIDDYLDSLTTDEFQKVTVRMSVAKGQGCYIPFGHFAYFIGVSDDPLNEKSYTGYLYTPVLDNAQVNLASTEMKRHCKAQVLKRFATKSKIVKQPEIDFVTGWLGTWPMEEEGAEGSSDDDSAKNKPKTRIKGKRGKNK